MICVRTCGEQIEQPWCSCLDKQAGRGHVAVQRYKIKKLKKTQRLPVMVASVVPACAACVHVEDNRSTHGVGACGQLMNVV